MVHITIHSVSKRILVRIGSFDWLFSNVTAGSTHYFVGPGTALDGDDIPDNNIFEMRGKHTTHSSRYMSHKTNFFFLSYELGLGISITILLNRFLADSSPHSSDSWGIYCWRCPSFETCHVSKESGTNRRIVSDGLFLSVVCFYMLTGFEASCLDNSLRMRLCLRGRFSTQLV